MKRRLLASFAVILSGLFLAGCNTGAPQGVLPRTEVPPPPSLNVRDTSARMTNAQKSNPITQQPPVKVPGTMATPRPSSTDVQPALTGSGIGAGFKF